MLSDYARSIFIAAALAGSAVGATAAEITPAQDTSGQDTPVQDTIVRVRASGRLRCGAVPRPGLFEQAADGSARGLLAEICRAVAVAVSPEPLRAEFRAYDSAAAFDALREGRDDIAFLTASELIDAKLAGVLVPGPIVFFATTSVMVSAPSPAHALVDLAGQPICSMDGSSAQRHLEAWFAQAHLDFVRMGYREDGEMVDAYDVQVCRAMAGETTTLAAQRRDGGINHLRSRILPAPLATFSILALTGTQDARWAALVAWVVHTLVRADVAKAPWTTAGTDALPLDLPRLGLAAGWQQRVVKTVGSYGDIHRRTLGSGSVYNLPRGPNAPLAEGGLMLAPFQE